LRQGCDESILRNAKSSYRSRGHMNGWLIVALTLAVAISPSFASARHSYSGRSRSYSHRSYSSHRRRVKSYSTFESRSIGRHPRSGNHRSYSSRSPRGYRYRSPSTQRLRDPDARAAFMRSHPCPATGRKSGACPGYVVDHIRPLACNGPDSPSNMQWQTVAEGKAKDEWERKGCR
jgi:hypothetical protein